LGLFFNTNDKMSFEEKDKEEKKLAPEVKGEEKSNAELIADEVQKQVAAVLAAQGLKPTTEPNSDMSAMEQMVTMMAKKLDQVGGPKSTQFEFNQAHSEIDYDPEDVLSKEEEVTFICHKMMYVIVDDKRGGKNVKAPLDKIIFDYDSTKQVKDGRETNLLNLSKYTCRSKTELEWLRDHSMFNIMFFDTVSGAMNADIERASLLVKHMTTLQGRGQQELIQMAKGMAGVDFRGDLNMLRAEIANYHVDQIMEANQNSTDRLFQQRMLSDSLSEAKSVGHVTT